MSKQFKNAIDAFGADCPIRILPICHPKNGYDIFINFKENSLTIACATCERPILKGAIDSLMDVSEFLKSIKTK